jgi:CspA family cold shock protein
MAVGTVKWFNDAKGYGFIRPDGGGADVFVHYQQIIGDGFKTLEEGQQVEYELREGPKGMLAERVAKTTS